MGIFGTAVGRGGGDGGGVMNRYRVTWRHEVEFKATNDEAARDLWESIDLNNFTKELTKGKIKNHGFVEEVSFECTSENYREVKR